MFASLPVRQEYVNTLTGEQKQCPECGTQMVPIGHEVIRTELKHIRPRLERVVLIAAIYGCPVCKETESP